MSLSHGGPGCSPELLALTDALCRIESWWKADGTGPGEGALAAHIHGILAEMPWLDLHLQSVLPGRPNLLALAGPPEDVDLLIVGHLDTVPPTGGWTMQQNMAQGGRYHALGAADTKGAIAAAIDAMAEAGPVRGFALLLYCDEEYDFQGMRHFLEHWPSLRPNEVLSLCGAPARLLTGCRGLLELDLVLEGRPGHASRPEEGASVTRALAHVITDLHAACDAVRGPHRTTCNVAAIEAGSRGPGDAPSPGAPPPTDATPNRIPDAAWMLVEIRTGSAHFDTSRVQQVVERSLTQHSPGVRLVRVHTRQRLPGYASPPAALPRVTTALEAVHHGNTTSPSKAGYIDVALLSADRGCPALCTSPACGGAHGSDEWVDLASLQSYRDGLVDLLRGLT